MKPSADRRTQQDRKSRQDRWCRLHLQVMRGSFWRTAEQELLKHYKQLWVLLFHLFIRFLTLGKSVCLAGLRSAIGNVCVAFIHVKSITLHSMPSGQQCMWSSQQSPYTYTQLYTCMSWSF